MPGIIKYPAFGDALATIEHRRDNERLPLVTELPSYIQPKSVLPPHKVSSQAGIATFAPKAN